MILISISLLLFYINYFVTSYSNDFIYNNINTIPKNKVGLVLGTSKYLSNGEENLFFKYRIEASYKLLKNKKIEFILVSGDNRHISYNEPIMMKNALNELGVPDSLIFLDYAGFRTLDAVIRCSKVFGENNFTIISQKFHNQRAIFIAKNNKINAIAFNAKKVDYQRGLKTYIRELFARVKAILDIYILKTEPKFLGEPIKIE